MKYILLQISLFLLLTSCITQFVPSPTEVQEMLVVEALITDQPGEKTVRLSRSMPLGKRSEAKPVTRFMVTVSDDQGNVYYYHETDTGMYVSYFTGQAGRFYRLQIRSYDGLNYESTPTELKSVPLIDSLYYEKVKIAGTEIFPQEGCRIYLSTHDVTNNCKYFRWEFTETWQFRLPYEVPNQTCWITDGSDIINIKSTAALGSSNIVRYPINYVTNQTDRLKIKYSLLVNQYSLNEDEFLYWEKLQNLSEQVGGLYDIIPSSVAGNLYCVDRPEEKVLGYFSVSGTTSRRIFIKDKFQGLANDLYTHDICEVDTVGPAEYIPNLNYTVWVIINHYMPDYRVLTYTRGCADCTTRGTTTKPDFWED